MELVYLWVEKYKNIENQGFNFSPRFTCSYDGESLAIDENKEHVSIFPENINITAIVGENGSGKSSILAGIAKGKTAICIDNKLFCKSFKIENNIKVEKSYLGEDYYDIIYLDSDLIKINPVNNLFDLFNWNIYDKNLYTKVENGKPSGEIFNIKKFKERFFNLISEHTESFNSKIFLFNPIKVTFSFHIHELDKNEKRFEEINKLIALANKNDSDKKTKFLIYLLKKSMEENKNIKNIEEQLPSISYNDILKYEDKILSLVVDSLKIDKDEINEIYVFLESLDLLNMEIKDFKTIYSKHKKSFLKLIDIRYLQINFIDAQERKYFALSQGERKLFTEFLMIYDGIKKSKNENLFLVLDEPDLALHPQWQKNYIKELMTLLFNFPTKKFHVIITSHSPFILSDIPKENVIFLEKYENGNCKNVTSETNIETFGANIHTLLSDGFFMKDGLMGEFAKEKIEEIKKFYYFNQKFKSRINAKEKIKERVKKYYLNKKEKFNHIQSIIGEPFLKTIMKNYLDELELIFSDDEDLINKELEELEKRKLYLEKLKNAKN